MSGQNCIHCGAAMSAGDRFCIHCGGDNEPSMAVSRGAVIGRDASCDIVIPLPSVSGQHCSVEVSPEGLKVTDLGSSNGTWFFFGDQPEASQLPEGQRSLVPFDGTLCLGDYRIHGTELQRRLEQRASFLTQPQPAQVSGGGMIAGRDDDCDIVFHDLSISGRHCRLWDQGETWVLEDIGSRNGTWVNGKRLRPRTKVTVKDQDRILFGRLNVALSSLKRRDFSAEEGAVRVDVIDIKRVVPDRETGGRTNKTILQPTSLSVYPGELVALMGPSGAGKTTFMNMLNGYEPPQGGRVLYNGIDLYRHKDMFRDRIGYVPQDDIVHEKLTVEDALRYALRLHAGGVLQDEEARITRTLNDVDLIPQRKEIVGSPENKTLSGGQRKRVNLALELICEPKVLFLDEPTSGLSSKDALSVAKLLRRLCDQGRTIILTIHQPSMEVFGCMDNLCLFDKNGHLAFYGSTGEAMRYFDLAGSPDADVIFEKLEASQGGKRLTTPEEWGARFQQSPAYQTYVVGRQTDRDTHSDAQPWGGEARRNPLLRLTDALVQLQTLLSRRLLILREEKGMLGFILFQAIVVGGLLASMFGKSFYATKEGDTTSAANGLFLLLVATIFFGCFNACQEIVSELKIFERERKKNLALMPYWASKWIPFTAISAAQVVILVGCAAVADVFEAELAGVLLILLVLVASSVSLGLLVSSLFNSANLALRWVPLILVIKIMFAGLLRPMPWNPPCTGSETTCGSAQCTPPSPCDWHQCLDCTGWEALVNRGGRFLGHLSFFSLQELLDLEGQALAATSSSDSGAYCERLKEDPGNRACVFPCLDTADARLKGGAARLAGIKRGDDDDGDWASACAWRVDLIHKHGFQEDQKSWNFMVLLSSGLFFLILSLFFLRRKVIR